MNLNMEYGVDAESRGITCYAGFKLRQKEQVFLIIKVGVHFELEENAWEGFLSPESEQLNVPLDFARHLAVLTLGTVRGVLHAKTETTVFNQFPLPTINLTDVIKEPLIISLSPD